MFLLLGVGEFGFMGMHVKPDDAVKEIDYLVDAYDTLSKLWGLDVSSLYSNH